MHAYCVLHLYIYSKREMSKKPCKMYLSVSEKGRKTKEIGAALLKLPIISSFLSANDKNASDNKLGVAQVHQNHWQWIQAFAKLKYNPPVVKLM
jgi:hypothetical protein